MQGPAACAVASLLASPEGRHRLTAPLPPVLVACGGAAPRGPALPQPEPLARRPPLPPLRQREAAWSVVLVTSPPLQPCPVNHPLAARPAPDAGLSVWPRYAAQPLRPCNCGMAVLRISAGAWLAPAPST